MTVDVPEAADRLAGELADAFATDRGLAERLNACQRRLQAANDRLWSGLHPDALGLSTTAPRLVRARASLPRGSSTRCA